MDKKSEVYSRYYLRGLKNPKKSTQAPDVVFNKSDFQQSLDIEHQRAYPKIVFLGTVSTMATPYRNNSSILVHTT